MHNTIEIVAFGFPNEQLAGPESDNRRIGACEIRHHQSIIVSKNRQEFKLNCVGCIGYCR